MTRMLEDNSDQIAEWNGALGERWARQQEELDALTAPFGEDALAATAPRQGEQVIDIGCGCGATSLALARAVGPQGFVTGLDVSRAMLEVARRRAAEAGLGNVSFHETDASAGELPQGQDLLYSRFGVMFFAEPAAAFAHLRRALKQTGRLAFVCWRAAKDNPWASVPVVAGRQAAGLPNLAHDPNAPGPFAFAQEARVRVILAKAGFHTVMIEPREHLIHVGGTTREAAENSVRLGPVARVVREAGPDALARITDGIEAALKPLARPDGAVMLPGRTWLVAASAN